MIGAEGRTYALDAGVVIALQRAQRLNALGAAASRVPIVIVEEVRDELIDVPPKHAHFASEVRQALLSPGLVRVESIALGDPAAAVLGTLRRGRTASTDLGEAASIAWASRRPDAVLVLRDGHAAMLAVEELRGRVLGLFGFLMVLVDVGVVDRSQMAELATALAQAPDVKARIPTWWAAVASERVTSSS